MKALNPEAEVAAVVDTLFRRWPSLIGFSITQVPARGLMVSDIETLPWSSESRDLFGRIAEALTDLVAEEPAARDLLHGRTFARTLH
jgi:hypothetical protein